MLKIPEQNEKITASIHYFPSTKSKLDVIKIINQIYEKLISFKNKFESEKFKGYQNHSFFWFLDNFYILEEQSNILKRDFPQKYCNQLPRLNSGPHIGFPRIYSLTREFILISNGKIELKELEEFLHSYQGTNELTIGEIWAIAICLRIGLLEVLIENLKRVEDQAEESRQADQRADELFEIVSKENFSEEISKYIKCHFSSPENLNRTFTTELLTKLRDQDPAFQEIINIFENSSKVFGMSLTEVYHQEHVEQAKTQISVSNIINSLRLITKMEWHPFFEKISQVDSLFKDDPTNEYERMDRSTKDAYRKKVEILSRKSRINETEVIKACLSLSKENSIHIGHFLMGKKEHILIKKLGIIKSFPETLKQMGENHPALFYFSALIFFFLCGTFLTFNAFIDKTSPPFLVLTLAPIFFIPLSEFSIGIVNTMITQIRSPRSLFKLDFKDGVPDEQKTMVVIPCLLINKKTIDDLIQQLELHYLSNSDENITFALLADPVDHSEEIKNDDDELQEYSKKRIANLNGRYKGKERFFFFHRKRVWNQSEGKWIAYERKRGKISEFNQLTRGSKKTTFLNENINWDFLRQLKYIITLDADTQLPINAAKKLIGTISHPLNRPIFDDSGKKIVSGYAIIQPRVSVSMVSSIQTRFAQIFSGNTGLDPYTTAVSDVYQDLFGEGNYTGKGLYHIDAFEKVLEDIIPDNIILSHDLFEGCLARVGLATDIEVYDDYPENFTIFSKRNHRWTRGDWQLMGWLFPKVKNKKNKRIKNPISFLGRWKILDNLRRSLVAPMTILSLCFCWIMGPIDPFKGTLSIILFVNSSLICSIILDFLKVQRSNFRDHLKNNTFVLKTKIEQIFLMIVYLPEVGLVNVDAIIRASYRSFISKKKTLEWVSFSQTQVGQSNWKDLISFGPLLSFSLFFLIYFIKQEALLISFPFISTWLLTPYISYGTQRKIPPKYNPLSITEINDYRRYARLTWQFFEKFATQDQNWLAPDNFQEDPKPQIAFRTSPTNIGLQLLSNLAAFDLGFISLTHFIERTEGVLKSLQIMEKFNGHLYNWYDTKTLSPLNPKYISTVDSGNLAGYLITLKQGVLSTATILQSGKYQEERAGVKDTIHIIKEKLDCLMKGKQSIVRKISNHLEYLSLNLSNLSLNELNQKSADILKSSRDLDFPENESLKEEIQQLCQSLSNQCQGLYEDTQLNSNKIRLRLKSIAYQAHELAYKMDFKFLFDYEQMIFSIGQKANEPHKDTSYYDLLASESRLASYFAIAKGDIPDDHWFRLSRQMVHNSKSRVLVSWSATMFEYLMPLLVMRRFEDTLLDQTYESIVKSQMDFGNKNKIPWGISESGYNSRDLQHNYQYAAFGIPNVGLKNSLPGNIVVSPYSTMLAAMIAPQESLKNLKQLEQMNTLGAYGFYESIDYAPSRIPKDQNFIILKSFMAHHQGMSLIAINNLINDKIMQNRFHAENRIKSSQILLQERAPTSAHISKKNFETANHKDESNKIYSDPRRKLKSKRELLTESQILSNGKLSLHIAGDGQGYLKLDETHLGRWGQERNEINYGQQILIRDITSNKMHSFENGSQENQIQNTETIFSEDKVQILKEFDDFKIETEILISSESDVEIRKITISNKMTVPKDIEILTYQELALCPPKTYFAHPAFHNLFIKTSYNEKYDSLIAIRNGNDKNNQRVAFQMIKSEKIEPTFKAFETDRSKIVKRMHKNFVFCHEDEINDFTNTLGAVLDPVFAIRKRFRIDSNSTNEFYLITGLTTKLEDALLLMEKYQKISISQRDCNLCWVTAQNTLNHFRIDADKAISYQKIGHSLFLKNQTKTYPRKAIEENYLTQQDLWSLGISGDIPIVTLRLKDEKELKILKDLIHSQDYMRLKGHIFDLVIINEEAPGYFQKLNDEIQRQIITCGSLQNINKHGGIFIICPHIAGKEKVDLVQIAASLNFIGAAGDLSIQISRIEKKNKKFARELNQPKRSVLIKKKLDILTSSNNLENNLELYNSYGGFEKKGAIYQILLKDLKQTPAPWLNVVCNNPYFGFQISESGQGFTWAINSRQNRISKWNNDPLSNRTSEAIFIQDEVNGLAWSPTPSPLTDLEDYVIKHEAGRTSFYHASNDIEQNLQLFCPLIESVKIYKLVLKNKINEIKKLSICFFVDWQLSAPDDAIRPVLTTWDESNQILWAQNRYHYSFSKQITFIASSLGINSVITDPELLFPLDKHLPHLNVTDQNNLNRHESKIPSCGFIKCGLDLLPSEEKTIIFLLGQTKSLKSIQSIQEKFLDEAAIQNCLSEVEHFWSDILSKITIETPSHELNIIFNHWLLYQTLACRIWARSAFYQSGGAYGYRDQLQDVMAIIYSRPEIAKEHILLAAGKQFLDGDVQHWWHPPTGQGIRTKFSDDLLWLPHVVAFYTETTDDYEILKISIPYLESIEIPEGHDEVYFTPKESLIKGSLYEHCLKALKRSLKNGRHGLSLMGSGDWNDGMNKVGNQGHGESVWLSWFLMATLKKFICVCEKEGDSYHVSIFNDHIAKLKTSIEEHAWDGDWYLRAYYDNGEKLGSRENDECQIDSIAQSWAILSTYGDKMRSKKAIESAYHRLYDPINNIIKLFDPPFHLSSQEPGYVKNYLPGVRENGGQYTHAGIWLMMAFAEIGDTEKTWNLLQSLNPLNHSFDEKSAKKYKLEPYVVAADIYGVEPHIGRGGWSWYTGSSSWLYRAILESFIGFKLKGNKLSFKPCLPRDWPSIKLTFTFGKSRYHITIIQSNEAVGIKIDNTLIDKSYLELQDDEKDYEVFVFTPLPTGKE